MFKNITTVSFLVLFIFLNALIGAASEPKQRLLEDIRFETLSETEERISFQLNGAYIPKIFAIKGERPRVVFDFPDIRPARLLKNSFNTNGKFIKRIRVGIHNKPDAKTRVVFDLMPEQEIDFKQDFDQQKNTLIITVYHAGSAPASRPEVVEPKKELSPELPVQAEKKVPPSGISETAVPADTQLPAVKEPATPAPVLPVPDQTVSHSQQSIEPVQPEPAQVEPAHSEPAESKPMELQPATTPSEPLPAAPATVEQPPTVPPSPDLSDDSQTILSSITFDNSTNRGEMVLFQLNEFHSPIVFGVEEGGPRIVCDFKNTAADGNLPGLIKTDGKYVHSIRIGLETAPQKVRVVLDLAPDYRYDLQQVFFKKTNRFALIINTLHNKRKTKNLNKPEKQE
jgi:hypothetical protein